MLADDLTPLALQKAVSFYRPENKKCSQENTPEHSTRERVAFSLSFLLRVPTASSPSS